MKKFPFPQAAESKKYLLPRGHTEVSMILAVSPRAGGNTDCAAQHFAKGVAHITGTLPHVHYLRDFTVSPCISCGFCTKNPGHCTLEQKDDAKLLFNMLIQSPWVFIASPIYFYHVPARFKAWIDRGQAYYHTKQSNAPARKAYICLLAGRKKGKQLFNGSLLTLKYFFRDFSLVPEPELSFLGVDKPEDLSSRKQDLADIEAMGKQAAS